MSKGGCAKHGQGFRSQNLKRNDILIANVQEGARAEVKNFKRTKPKSFITAVHWWPGFKMLFIKSEFLGHWQLT